jgi:DNA-binding response OmpR family regulator
MTELVRALVIDDEERIRYFLTKTLERVGYIVMTAPSGEKALDLLRNTAFDLAIIDLGLGGRVDGLKVLESIRWRWPGMATVILTAHGSLESAMAAIREGVDGYLLKPAQPEEVREAAQRALERREALRASEAEERRIVQRGGFFVDLRHYQATHDGQELKLTSQELKLLGCLMQNAPEVVSPWHLARVVREYEPADLQEARQIVKWYIHRLRQRIEPEPSDPRHVLNVRGMGYKFKG